MIYPFNVTKVKNGEETFWLAKSIVLKGVVGQGNSPEEAVLEMQDNENDWLKSAEEDHMEIPDVPVQDLCPYSGKLMLRIASYTHEEAARLAKEKGISLNQYLNDAVVAQNNKFAAI